MRRRCKDFYDNDRALEHLPLHYFNEFSKKTGLPYQCLGGEVSFTELKANRDKFTYCRLGSLYVGFIAEGRSYEPKYKLIVTKVEAGQKPTELYYNHVSTFHKTWGGKEVSENDPDFIKPKVDPALKDVQAVSYYGVEHVETNGDGFDVYRNTFMGGTAGYCVKKDGVTYHADTLDEALAGWLYKVDSEKEDVSGSGVDLDRALTANLLHKKYGFCETGMGAFCEDYGLDYFGRYTVGQLRQIVHRRSSTFRYTSELKRIKIIA